MMRVVSLLGVFLLLCVASTQEQTIFADIQECDTELGWINDAPSEEWRQLAKAMDNRTQMAKAAMRNMMMGLRFEQRDVPVVRIPIQRGLSVSFMYPFRGGVFLTACQRRMRRGRVTTEPYYVDLASGEIRRRPLLDRARGLYAAVDCQPCEMTPDEDCYTVGCYLDLEDRKVHRIRVAEVNEVCAAVVAGERAWLAGLTDGKAVLVGINDEDRITVPLPHENGIPDLGVDGQSLLAVYPRTIHRLTDRQWTLVYSGDIVLPRSGLPPQRHGNMVFIRDEGRESSSKRLWLLTMMGEKSHPLWFARDIVLAEPIVRSGPPLMESQPIESPDWADASSYCVTGSGDLWACVAHGSFLLRRSQDGSYAIAIANNSVQFREDPINSWEADQGLRISAITALPDESLLLAGLTGLYRLKGNELAQEIAFTYEEISNSSSRFVRHWGCDLTNVLPLDDQSYVISSGSRGGVYLLGQGDDSQWSAQPLDEGDPVVW